MVEKFLKRAEGTEATTAGVRSANLKSVQKQSSIIKKKLTKNEIWKRPGERSFRKLNFKDDYKNVHKWNETN